jgi:hypothetical protein
MTTKEFLLKSRVYPNLAGFNYLIDAVELVASGERKVTKIYQIIADRNKATGSKVERAIRYLNETRLATRVYKGFMNNSELIFWLANKGGNKK